LGPAAAVGHTLEAEGAMRRRLGRVGPVEAGTGTVPGPVEAGIDTVLVLAELDIEMVPVLAEARIGAVPVLAETKIGTVPVQIAAGKIAAPVAGCNAAVRAKQYSSVVLVVPVNAVRRALVLCLEDKQKSSELEDKSVVVRYTCPQNSFVDRKQLLIPLVLFEITIVKMGSYHDEDTDPLVGFFLWDQKLAAAVDAVGKGEELGSQNRRLLG
jgi:hypothetical protein